MLPERRFIRHVQIIPIRIDVQHSTFDRLNTKTNKNNWMRWWMNENSFIVDIQSLKSWNLFGKIDDTRWIIVQLSDAAQPKIVAFAIANRQILENEKFRFDKSLLMKKFREKQNNEWRKMFDKNQSFRIIFSNEKILNWFQRGIESTFETDLRHHVSINKRLYEVKELRL